MSEYGKKYYATNREKLLENGKRYRYLEKQNNPEQRMARSRRHDRNKLTKNEHLLVSLAGRPRPTKCEVCGGRSPRNMELVRLYSITAMLLEISGAGSVLRVMLSLASSRTTQKS